MILLLLGLIFTAEPGWNTCFGQNAGRNIYQGDHNIILGTNAGQDIVNDSYWLILGSFRLKLTHPQWCAIHQALEPVFNLPPSEKVCEGTGPAL